MAQGAQRGWVRGVWLTAGGLLKQWGARAEEEAGAFAWIGMTSGREVTPGTLGRSSNQGAWL